MRLMREIRLVESKFRFLSMHRCYVNHLHKNFYGFICVFCLIMPDLINGRRVVASCQLAC